MKKSIIAIDVDEVLLPLHEHFLAHHNQTYGTEFSFPDPKGRYLLQKFTGEDGTATLQKLQKFYASGETKHLQLLPGAAAAIKQLKKHYDLVIISSQQLFQAEHTKAVLKEQFGDIFKKIYFTGIRDVIGHHPVTKSELCLQAGASYLIDDTIANATHCAEVDVDVILFSDYHWNQTESLPAGITRCKDWAAVLEYFDGRD